MPDDRADRAPTAIRGVLFDLLMAVMNSIDVWVAAAGDTRRGLAWRDATTMRMAATGRYERYEGLVDAAATDLGLPSDATSRLVERWSEMRPWPDARAIGTLAVPYGFVTNCSAALARVAAERSGLDPRFVLSAEEAGWYKPDPRTYREARRRLGTDPDLTGFVAGSPFDAEGARTAGLRTWLVIRRPDHRPGERPIETSRSLLPIVEAINQGSLAGSTPG